ncbi:MAG: hypothetical protein AB7S41_15555 [Parvibaculaceae bacterium]
MRKGMIATTAALGVAMLLLSAEAASSAQSKVRVWTPTVAPEVPEYLDRAETATSQPAPRIIQQIAIVVGYRYYDRDRAIRRALGQRYLGFHRTYSGPLYPF